MTKYAVRYIVHNYNNSVRRESHDNNFDDFESAETHYTVIKTSIENGTSNEFLDKLCINGFVDKLVGIFKIVEKKIL